MYNARDQPMNHPDEFFDIDEFVNAAIANLSKDDDVNAKEAAASHPKATFNPNTGATANPPMTAFNAGHVPIFAGYDVFDQQNHHWPVATNYTQAPAAAAAAAAGGNADRPSRDERCAQEAGIPFRDQDIVDQPRERFNLNEEQLDRPQERPGSGPKDGPGGSAKEAVEVVRRDRKAEEHCGGLKQGAAGRWEGYQPRVGEGRGQNRL